MEKDENLLKEMGHKLRQLRQILGNLHGEGGSFFVWRLFHPQRNRNEMD